jgi:hypothetical protein
MTLNRRSSVAKWRASALATYFGRFSYAFKPRVELRLLRPQSGACFATKISVEIANTLPPIALLNNEVWDAHYQELVDFSNNGHLCVKIEASIAQKEALSLAYFCDTCRVHFQYRFSENSKTRMRTNILNSTRIELLDKLGFDWSALDAKWEMRFQQAETFAREHGHCNVPNRWISNPQVVTWICKQRTLYCTGRGLETVGR